MSKFAGGAPGFVNGWVNEIKVVIYQALFFVVFVIAFIYRSKAANFPVR